MNHNELRFSEISNRRFFTKFTPEAIWVEENRPQKASVIVVEYCTIRLWIISDRLNHVAFDMGCNFQFKNRRSWKRLLRLVITSFAAVDISYRIFFLIFF